MRDYTKSLASGSGVQFKPQDKVIVRYGRIRKSLYFIFASIQAE